MTRGRSRASQRRTRGAIDRTTLPERLELPERLVRLRRAVLARAGGGAMVILALWYATSLATFSISDPSLSNKTAAPIRNAAGNLGAIISDISLQAIGGAAWLIAPILLVWGTVAMFRGGRIISETTSPNVWIRIALTPICLCLAAITGASAPVPISWPFATAMGGVIGDLSLHGLLGFLVNAGPGGIVPVIGIFAGICALSMFAYICGLTVERAEAAGHAAAILTRRVTRFLKRTQFVAPVLLSSAKKQATPARSEPRIHAAEHEMDDAPLDTPYPFTEEADVDDNRKPNIIEPTRQKKKASRREAADAQHKLPMFSPGTYELPSLSLFAKPPAKKAAKVSHEALEQNARMLETVLADFGVRGSIINIRPGPVVTLYELEPAAGIKSSRVIGLADDIARSMSAIAARVAVIPGRNAIGIELPNQSRETVFIRELIGAEEYENSRGDLTLTLGQSIGGEPVFADLARMPHLLIAGTTGSGKSVGINVMILSLLYRLSPDQCKLIMIDPKMLELSVYEGIPHLLSPVVTDPTKAVVALKWTVREMEERYRKMSKVGVRNISGFNQRVREAAENGEILSRTVHTGYDQETHEPVYETEELDYEPMPFIVVIIDEVADLMMVAGKDIEAMVQRLAQMARAAGIHLIMATQRPSVDVITGTIKANFPTRISFQVTSKIDSRTILGEQGAEQLLGQGDMLHMAGGGRIRRVHGAFVSDDEVEKVVRFLKKQGKPDYIQEVTELSDEDGAIAGLDIGGNTSSGDALYDKAVAVVLRDRKPSISYVQRRLQIGYNRAATLIERMEDEGVVSEANHAGKRQILVGDNAA